MQVLRFSLKGLLEIVSKVFDENFSDFVFDVEASLSKVKYSKKYLHLELVEFDENGQLLAKAKGVIFNKELIDRFKNIVKESDFNGLKKYLFVFRGRISFHSEYGFSIIIENFEYQIKEETDLILEKLRREGILEKNKILPLPYPPFKIAIISSTTSEGLKDFLTILRNSGYNFQFYLYESAIHGNRAKDEVLENLRKLYKNILNGQKVDFIVILRGGGGSHGILWQNDYQISRAICFMPVPVIVAIGHTSDRFVLDEVAKISAKTPSEAAYYLIDLIRDYEKKLDDFLNYIHEEIVLKIKEYDKQLDLLKSKIDDEINYRVNYYKAQLSVMFDFIKNFDIELLLKKGLAVLVDEDKNVLPRFVIERLKKGDVINILVSGNKIIKANIIDIIEFDKNK